MPLHMRRDQFDPSPDLAKLRSGAPVTRIELFFREDAGTTWLVTGYEEARQVLGDAAHFLNAPDGGKPEGRSRDDGGPGEAQGFLLGMDPPDHTRVRRMLTGEFTVRQMRRLQPRIDAIVTGLLDDMERAGPPADLMQSFALPIPSLVICELLGVPYADRAGFQRRSELRMDMSRSPEERAAFGAQSLRYMFKLVKLQRADPGDDVLGMLVRDHGDELTDRELVAIGDLMLGAGHETTASMLGLGTALLLVNPDQLALLRDGPSVADRAVEELLRYVSIIHTPVPRTAKTDVVIGGQLISAGDRVLCSVPVANRSGDFGDDMDRLDLSRDPVPHLAFGHGVHYCIGAHVARMEMRTAFPALLRRFPSLSLAVPIEEVQFRTSSPVYGLESLPVTW